MTHDLPYYKHLALRSNTMMDTARPMKNSLCSTLKPEKLTHRSRRLAGALLLAMAFAGAAPMTLATTALPVVAASSSSVDALSRLLVAQPALLVGQSATQLADGQWLVIGGASAGVAGNQAWRIGADGQRTALPSTLHLSRSRHSATLLPDGKVLVLGGVDAHGGVLADAELFDPATGAFTDLGSLGLAGRSAHSATVLMDGRVLLAGGVDASGNPIRDVDIYDPVSRRIERLTAKLGSDRIAPTTLLLPDNRVLIWSGSTASGQAQATADVYSSDSGQFSTLPMDAVQQLANGLARSAAPGVLGQLPSSGATNVPVAQRLVLRFSQKMAIGSFNNATVTLMGPNGAVGVLPVAVDNGVLLFATPTQELLPASSYTLFVQGATDQFGQPLPLTAVGFKTVALNTARTATAIAQATLAQGALASGSGKTVSGNTTGPASKDAAPVPAPKAPTNQMVTSIETAEDGELWVPGVGDHYGQWRRGDRNVSLQHLPKNLALRRVLYGYPELMSLTPADVAMKRIPNVEPLATGVTSVSGQVLRLNGVPLVNATLSMGDQQVKTDENGEFTLSPVPSGRQTLVINGESATIGEHHYGRYEYGFNVEAGKPNLLPFVIWMSRLNPQTVKIASPTESDTVLSNPQIPGLELRIPAGMVIRDANGKIVTEISMTAVPVNQPPFPLPHINVPVYFTVQPGGSHLEGINAASAKGAQIVYPNYPHAKPGTRMTFWDYDAAKRGWFEYGQGTVTADGKQVMPDANVRIYEFTGAMITTMAPSTNAPTTGPKDCGCKTADPVDTYSGLFINQETDLTISDIVPIRVSRSYRQADDASRAFGIGTNLSYDMFLTGGYDTSKDQILPYASLIKPDGGQINFVRVSGGTGYTNAVFQSTSDPTTAYYGAIVKWDTTYPGADWSVTLKTGDVYYFPGVGDGSGTARQGAMLGMKDRFGNLTQLVRTNANLTQIISPSGRNVYLTYDGSNRITQIQDDLARTVGYAYDASGRLMTVTDPMGKTTQYTYGTQTLDPAHSVGGVKSSTNMLTVTDKNGNVKTSNVFDSNGRLSKQTYADGRFFQFGYVLQSSQTGTGTSTAGFDTVLQTDATDERGTVTRYSFDTNGAPTSVISAFGTTLQQTASNNWNSTTHLLDSTTDAMGRVTAYQYDRLGNKTQITQLAGTSNAVTTNVAYDLTYSLPTSITDPNGNSVTLTYNNLGNLTQATDALGHAVVMTYDSKGRRTSITDALGHATSFAYAGADLQAVTDALGRTVSSYTDIVGRPTSVTDMLNNRTYVAYDNLDRATAITNAKGGVAQIGYDANGNVLSQIDENNNATGFTYDSRDRMSSMTDALAHKATASYEPGGKVSQSVDNKGQITNRTYDALGRLTSISYGANAGGTSSASNTTFTWDNGNRLTQIVDSVSGTITRNYDLLDRTLSETTPQGTVTRTFDAAGRRLTLTVAGQPTISYSYDVVNRLTQIQQAAGSSNGNVAQTTGYTYDNANRLTQRVYPNGIHASYSYDNGNQITGIAYAKADGSAIGDLSYTYDTVGRRTGVGGSLAQINPGAAVSTTSFNAANQLTTFGTQTLTYDANGNLTSDGTNTYIWDERNQLQSIAGSNMASFQYDAMGRRVGKTIGTTSTGYLYDGINFVQEKSGTGSGAGVTANLVTGPGVDNVLVRQTNAGNQTMLTDALGSIIMATDATQATVSSYSYDAYGNTIQVGTNDNSQQYTGRENDATGLYYYRARYYSPAMGRFISQDPIGWASGQTNGFSYVNGNPLSEVDPYGQQMVESDSSGFKADIHEAAGNGNEVVQSEAQANPALALCHQWIETCPGDVIISKPPELECDPDPHMCTKENQSGKRICRPKTPNFKYIPAPFKFFNK